MTDDLVVIWGPRTTLAEHLLATPWASEHQLLLVARHREEAAALASRYPCARVLCCGDGESGCTWPAARSVTVVVCAFGLIHPATPDWTSHSTAMSRDLETMGRMLDQCQQGPVTLIFVSTALAAVPNRKQSYYVAWKCLAEALIERIGQERHRVRFCVLLPGRLVRKRTLSRPLSLLHTTYGRLTRIIIEAASAPKTQRRIIGPDARALMLVEAVRLMVNGGLGRSA